MRRKKTQLVGNLREILGVIVMLESPLSVTSLSKLLNLPVERINRRRLGSLH
jgi:molybdate-binding protein